MTSLFSFSSELSNALLRLIAQHSQVEPNIEPTVKPTFEPTVEPTVESAVKPTVRPIVEPTNIQTNHRHLQSELIAVDLMMYINWFNNDANQYTIQTDCKLLPLCTSKHLLAILPSMPARRLRFNPLIARWLVTAIAILFFAIHSITHTSTHKWCQA